MEGDQDLIIGQQTEKENGRGGEEMEMEMEMEMEIENEKLGCCLGKSAGQAGPESILRQVEEGEEEESALVFQLLDLIF